jgi:copper resistance protein B
MSRLLLSALALGLASPALAQAPDPHAGHATPAAPAPATPAAPAPATPDPHAGHRMPAAPAASPDPHAGHHMPATPPSDAPDPHAGHEGSAAAGAGADLPVGDAAPPAAPADLMSERVFGVEAMAAARRTLAREHGRVRIATTRLDRLELRPDAGGDAYAWEGGFRWGGDIHRLALKSEGEGRTNGRLGEAELQALYSRAVTPYFDLQVGVRHDLRPGPQRTYATVGVEGLAPYWFDVDAALFVSDRGDVSARLQADYDLRITQRLILQPAAELTLAASDDVATGVGSGLSGAEAGLRLRYEIRREFAPYVGVHYERRFGRTADLARTAGEPAGETRIVLGVRTWF